MNYGLNIGPKRPSLEFLLLFSLFPVSRGGLVATDYLFLQSGQASGAFRLCVNVSPENK